MLPNAVPGVVEGFRESRDSFYTQPGSDPSGTERRTGSSDRAIVEMNDVLNLHWGARFVAWTHMEREGAPLWGVRCLVVAIHVVGVATIFGVIGVIAFHRESVRQEERRNAYKLKADIGQLIQINLGLQKANEEQRAELAKIRRVFSEQQRMVGAQFS